MRGSDIRKMILNAGLRIWVVAKAYGVADTTFSRYLRSDFSDEDTERVIKIIDELSKEAKK